MDLFHIRHLLKDLELNYEYVVRGKHSTVFILLKDIPKFFEFKKKKRLREKINLFKSHIPIVIHIVWVQRVNHSITSDLLKSTLWRTDDS
jgi:c-di-GMP-binding flagellar brake protein YcgR